MPREKDTLKQLANEACKQHRQVIGAARDMIRHAKLSGVALNAAKKRLKHGEWDKWLKAHFEASAETARAYMRIASQWKRLQPEIESNSSLSLDRALEIIRVHRPCNSDPNRKAWARSSRGRLVRQFTNTIEFWPDDVVIFLSYICFFTGEMTEFLDSIRGEVEPLAMLVVPVEERRAMSIRGLDFWSVEGSRARGEADETYLRELRES